MKIDLFLQFTCAILFCQLVIYLSSIVDSLSGILLISTIMISFFILIMKGGEKTNGKKREG